MPRTPRMAAVAAPASRRLLALALTLAGLLATSSPARAATTDGTLTAGGMHIAAGTLVDPAGRTWVADHLAGFCRLGEPSDTGPGQIEHPQQPDQPGPRTCLGGLRPDAQPGPLAAGQPTLADPTPDFVNSGDEMALIPDASSKSSEIVRARWNPATGLFEYVDTVTMQGARERPVATSLGPDGRVYVAFQRAPTIQRIDDPGGTPTVETVGRTSDGAGARALAAGRDAGGHLTVYVAEAAGLRKLQPDAGLQPFTAPAFDLPAAGAAGGAAAVGSMAYDQVAHLLWVGTADGAAPADEGIDRLVRIATDTGTVELQHARGFSMIGGVAVRPSGEVDVVDERALLQPTQPVGLGRLFRTGRPVAHVTRGPLANGQETPDGRSSRDPSPSFEVAGPGTLECLLSGPGLGGTTWGSCPADAVVQVDRDLADGGYVLSVRATVGGVAGLPEAKAFVVDTVAPLRPRILRPADGTTVSGTPWFQFDAEPDATFTCRFDGEASASPCRPGRTRSFDAAGTHTLEITAVDGAGNESAASLPATFTVDPALRPTLPPGITGGPMRHHGSTLAGAGLHIPAGAIVDPEGRVWVSDHNAGFCRVTSPGEDGPGHIDHPQVPGDPGPRTCLGGLLPDAQPGAPAAGQPAFVDPTPGRPGSGDEVVLVPDVSSASSELYRARWNRDTGLFEPLDTVTTIGGAGRGTRPVAASTDADGNVYVAFQREATIQRVAAAAGPNPTVRVVGLMRSGRGAGAVAAGRDADGQTTVYVDERGLISSLHPNAVTPPVTAPSFALAGAPAVGALAYDLTADRLWVGTANAAAVGAAVAPGTDQLARVTIVTGAVEERYAGGYSVVGGLAVRPDGFVLVLDDPALLEPTQPIGLGRMFQVGLPAAHIAHGPLLPDGTEAADPAAIASTTPGFDVQAAEGTAQCRLRRPGHALDTGWAPCAADGRFAAAEPLAEGSYLLTVRAVDGDVMGLVEARRFDVDLTPPARPRITSPAAPVVGATPWFAFDAEPGARFECRWEQQGGFAPCAPGRTRTFAENGDHVLEVRALDRAGNVSDPSEPLRFSARANATAVTIDSGPEGRSRNTDASFSFSADAVDVEFGCRLAGSEQVFSACSPPRAYSGLADGTYAFEVRARDSLGNISPVSRRRFTVDRTGPVTAVDVAEGATVRGSDSIGVSADEPATWHCRFDDAPFAPCGSSVPVAGLAAGDHVLRIIGIDDLGNVGALLERRFVIAAPATAAPGPRPFAPLAASPPAPAPAITLITRGTAQALTIRIADIAPTVDLALLRSTGIVVQVIPARGTQLIRFRVYRATGGGRIASARRPQPVLTVFKRAPRGHGNVRLTPRELRRLHPGRYTLEVTPARSRTKVGRPVTRRFRVVR